MRLGAGWMALAAVACLALAACGSLKDNPTPTPSASVSYDLPSPVPTVTVDADRRALPGYVTESGELPPAQQAPTTLLDQATAGWSLATYRPSVAPVVTVGGVVPGYDATVQVVYLISPEGQRFQLLDLDPTVPIVIDSWTAGESIAYVRQCEPLDCDPATPTQQLNLATGEISPLALDVAGMRVGATLPGSVRFWADGATRAALETDGRLTGYPVSWTAVSASPDGLYLAVERARDESPLLSAGLAVVNAETGRLTDIAMLWPEPLQCTAFRWRADDTLDISCYDPAREEWRVFAVGPGAEQMVENKSATATPPAEGPWVEPDFFVSDDAWAGPYTADAAARLVSTSTAVGLARNAGFEPLAVPDAGVGTARVVASANGSVYVEAEQGSRAESQAGAPQIGLKSVWRYDLAADRWYELAPLPPGGPTRGLLASQGAPASGLTSLVVAP